MLHENTADRAAVVKNAAVVPRTSPQLIAALRIVDQRPEKWSLQRGGVLLESTDKIFGDEFRSLFGEEDVAINVVEYLDWDIFETFTAHQYDNWHSRPRRRIRLISAAVLPSRP